MDLPTALAPEWSSTGLAIDDDEVEATYTGDAGLELTVRHTFVAGWQFRCALYNPSTDTRSVKLRLPLALGAETVGRAVAEGAEAEVFVQPWDGRGPILAGRLRQGSVERITSDGFVLPEVTLGPGARYVLGWEWDWLPRAAAYVRRRPTIHPRATTVLRGDVVVLPGGPDVAIVSNDDVVLASSSQEAYELCSVEPLVTHVELRSARGLRRLQVQWTPTPGELLRESANRLLAIPPGPAGVIGLPGLDAALTVQWVLAAETLDAPDDAADALDLFTARLLTTGLLTTGLLTTGLLTTGLLTTGLASDADVGLVALYLVGEYERSGDRDLLDAATSHVLGATRAAPGLGVAATRVSLARVALGLSPQSIMDHLLKLARREHAAAADLDGLASAAELLALTRAAAPSLSTTPRADDPLLEIIAVFGAALGAGLPGDPVRPLPVAELGHLLVALQMLPDTLAEPTGGRTWGVSAADLAGQRVPTLIAGLLGREVDAGHVWLGLLAGMD